MMLFAPEAVLIVLALVLFLLSLGGRDKSLLRSVTIGGGCAVVVAALLTYGAEGTLFYGAYRVDAFSQAVKVVLAGGFLFVIWMGAGLRGIDGRLRCEYCLFMTLSTLGLVFLSSAVELVTIILSLEISSFAVYVMVPLRGSGADRQQMEAGIKYILFGAAATGITLYGMGYVFGLTHTTYVDELLRVLPGMLPRQPLAVIGLALMLGGFFYKLALFPMHFWAPDVYQGSSNETAVFIATLPKVGAVALLVRLVSLSGTQLGQLTWFLAVIAVLAMTVGNLSALVQSDMKRLLAYSSIAHAGYVMVGILSGTETGMSAALFYISGYVLMNLACFYVIYHVSVDGGNVTIDDLRGLYRRSPVLAFCLAAGAFGMAGLPPTVGFTGKLMLFTGAIEKGLYALVILSVINTGIAAFYYLRMVRAAYSQDSEENGGIQLGFSACCLGVLLIAAILLTGILPQEIASFAHKAVLIVR